MKTTGVFMLAGAVMLAGFGCAGRQGVDGAPDVKAIIRMSPGDAARAIKFKSGSSFEIHQSALKVQNDWIQEDSALGRRVVSLNEYRANQRAVIQWTLQQKAKTAEYKKALTEYEAGTTTTKPEAAYKELVTAGSLKAIELENTHQILLPAFWREGERDAWSTGAVWVSKPIYEELSRTRTSTVYLNLFEALLDLTSDKPELQKSVLHLQSLANASAGRTDLDLMKAEGEMTDTKLQLNGSDVTVRVIKARNWFGEITVLDNPENPLILKFSLNPPLSGDAADASPSMNYLKELLGYEITRIDL